MLRTHVGESVTVTIRAEDGDQEVIHCILVERKDTVIVAPKDRLYLPELTMTVVIPSPDPTKKSEFAGGSQ